MVQLLELAASVGKDRVQSKVIGRRMGGDQGQGGWRMTTIYLGYILRQDDVSMYTIEFRI